MVSCMTLMIVQEEVLVVFMDIGQNPTRLYKY